MSFPDNTESRFREEGERDWAVRQLAVTQARLKNLLASHDRGELDLRGEAEELREELYGVDGFDHPKCMMVTVDAEGVQGAFRGPLLLNDLLDTGDPGPWPDAYKLFITQDGQRTHRWHGRKCQWVVLKSR